MGCLRGLARRCSTLRTLSELSDSSWSELTPLIRGRMEWSGPVSLPTVSMPRAPPAPLHREERGVDKAGTSAVRSPGGSPGWCSAGSIASANPTGVTGHSCMNASQFLASTMLGPSAASACSLNVRNWARVASCARSVSACASCPAEKRTRAGGSRHGRLGL